MTTTKTKKHLLAEARNSNFITGFLECAVWSSIDDNGESLANSYLISDFTAKALKYFIEMCNDFQEFNEELLERAYASTGNDEEQAGGDFWFSKEGHGTGFWDGAWGEYGDALTKAAKLYGEDNIYAYKGKLHVV